MKEKLTAAFLGTATLLDYMLIWSGFWLALLLVWSLAVEHIDDSAILFVLLLSVSFGDYLLVKYLPRENR